MPNYLFSRSLSAKFSVSVSDSSSSSSSPFYQELGILGTGAYGTVVKAQLPNQNRFLALKQLNAPREGAGIPQDAYREMKILKEFRHPNLVSLDKIIVDAQKRSVTLAYSYAEHDLNDIIRYHRQHSAPVDGRVVKSILHQLLSGLAFLHSRWAVHRDLKPQNLLIEDGRVRIADFGLARLFQCPQRKLSDDGDVVTIWYRAPELLLGAKHYNRAIDMWAVGAIIYEIITAMPLFPGEEAKSNKFQENQLRKIFQTLGKPTASEWPTLGDCPHSSKIEDWPAEEFRYCLNEKLAGAGVSQDSRLFGLIAGLLTFDPNKRLTAEAALNHPYFKEAPLPASNIFIKSNNSVAVYPQRILKPIQEKNKRAAREENTENSKRPRGAG